MALDIRILGCITSRDGSLWAALKLRNGEGEKVIYYRAGSWHNVDSKEARYLHEVADILFPNQIPLWRQIDSEKDYGFSPEAFRKAMRDLRYGASGNKCEFLGL